MWKFLKNNLKFFSKTIGIGLPIGVTVIDFIGYVAKVEGCSMQPCLNPDLAESDFVFLSNWAITKQAYHEVARGDVVALISPRNPKQRMIKRVIALEGDVIEIKDSSKPSYVKIPKGHCWVEGDNRGRSLDSTAFGPVALGLLKSKAKCIVWPPHRWQMLNGHVLPDRIPLNLRSSYLFGDDHINGWKDL